MVKGRVNADMFLPRLRQICLDEIAARSIVNGLVFTSAQKSDLMDGQAAGISAARHAMIFKLTGDEQFRQHAAALLNYCGSCVVQWKGVSFFPSATPNWCMDGRILRRAIFASRWIVHPVTTSTPSWSAP